MTPRHALQAAALQFGRDGTDRSLDELREAYRAFRDERIEAAYLPDLAGEAARISQLEAGLSGVGGTNWEVTPVFATESHSE
jgi:hypothetical protein